MAKPAICFDCEVGGLVRRLRRLLKIFRRGGKTRHCENCGHHLEEPVEAWKRERDADRDASAHNPGSNVIRDRPPRPKA